MDLYFCTLSSKFLKRRWVPFSKHLYLSGPSRVAVMEVAQSRFEFSKGSTFRGSALRSHIWG